ncbi:MAG TPA: flagellar basal body rod protein FlgC, partial [Candidatus Krumholzibacteria bacterium]|nr:flagellar basal body rod protein FlgC [Candidatus Krumholzibacteria bacterium]
MGDGLFSSIRISASGLSGQRVKMDVVAQNLANAETTRTEDGTPYRRQRAVFEQVLDRKLATHAQKLEQATEGRLSRTNPVHMDGSLGIGQKDPEGVDTQVELAEDASEFRVVYDPGHPDADEAGYVLLPNVNPITEMVDMITASRAYEANISAVQAAKDMFADA